MASPVHIGRGYESVAIEERHKASCDVQRQDLPRRGPSCEAPEVPKDHGSLLTRRRWIIAAVATVGLLALVLLPFRRPARGPIATPAPVEAGKQGASATRAKEAEACQQQPPTSQCTSEREPQPPVGQATPGERVRMPAFEGMEYQLFLPRSWQAAGSDFYPVVVFLHGAGDGRFSVMNSQSLPRLLVKDQSTCFDPRTCWCLSPEYAKVTAMREAGPGSPEPFVDEEEDLASPLADCDFAETFGAIVVMPQGWLPERRTGWTEEKQVQVEALTRFVLQTYRGDPTRVILTGQSAGGAGAWSFAARRPLLWAAVNVVCMPAPAFLAKELEGVHVWVVGWTGDGEMGNDDMVVALKQRVAGSVRYTRYTQAPAPPDPLYSDMLNHASYDLIYRDPRLWRWALALRNPRAAMEWGASQ